MLIDRQRVSLEGVSTAFLDAGRGDAIVALHGVPTSSALFEPLLPHVTGYRLIAPDLIGHGDSETPATGPLGYAAYKRHLDAFLAAVPPRDFYLLLHDLGGVLGLEWAADHAARVRGIVMLSTTVTWSFRVGVWLPAANLLLGRSVVRRGVPVALARRRALEPSLVETWAAPWTRTRALRSLDLFAQSHLERVQSKLGQIDAPALLIWGDKDVIFPLPFARPIVERLPQSKLVTIPRCGHWSTLDASEEVAHHAVEFLRSCAGSRR